MIYKTLTEDEVEELKRELESRLPGTAKVYHNIIYVHVLYIDIITLYIVNNMQCFYSGIYMHYYIGLYVQIYPNFV